MDNKAAFRALPEGLQERLENVVTWAYETLVDREEELAGDYCDCGQTPCECIEVTRRLLEEFREVVSGLMDELDVRHSWGSGTP